jgi:hypothetical protein
VGWRGAGSAGDRPYVMQHEANQQVGADPLPLSYAKAERRSRRLGIAGLFCALVSPCIYLLIIVLRNMNLHPGWRAAVTMVMLALASAVAGLCLSILSLRREAKNGWAASGLAISAVALCYNCFALGNA